MSAVNKMIITANFSVNGFQETVLVPILQKDNSWFSPSNWFQPRESPSLNIHHNSNNHWVCSFQFETDDCVYLLDSSINVERNLTDSFKIQLAHIYG